MINIHVVNGSFYIWNAQDACRVREECRVVGTLVGCLPRLPRQNIHLGLPLQLSAYESRLLLEKGFAKLHNDDNPSLEPSEDELQTFNTSRLQSYYEQLEACKIEKQKTMRQHLDRIVLGKKQKLKLIIEPETMPLSKKRKKKNMRRLLGSSSCDKIAEKDEIKEQIEQQIDNMSIPVSLPEKAICVQIPTANCWWRKDETDSVTEWNFESDPRDSLLYCVYKHFWELGYFLTSGGKFGGDFLIYPGDPSRYHSYYIAVCMDYDQPLSALDIIALGRLGTGVKKTILMCSVDSSGQVCYSSLQWSGIS